MADATSPGECSSSAGRPIHCSICDGIFNTDSDGQLFCLECLNLWLDDEGEVIDCTNCHGRESTKVGCSIMKLIGRQAQAAMAYEPIDCANFDFEIGKGVSSEVCLAHKEPHLFYCCTCQKAICKTCATYTHEPQGHRYKNIADMCPGQKKFTNEMCDVLKNRLEKEKEYIADIDNCLKRMNECAVKAVEEINQVMADRIQRIRENGDLLKRRLKEIRSTKSASLRERKSRAVLLAQHMEKALIDTSKSVQTFPDYIYAAKHEDINENMLKLCIEQQHEHDVLSGDIKFVPDGAVDLSSHLGKLLHRRSLRRETTFGEFKKITAIAGSPDGHLAIFDKKSKDVVIYKIMTVPDQDQGSREEYCQLCEISQYDDHVYNRGNIRRDSSTGIALTSAGILLLSNHHDGTVTQFDLNTRAYKESIILSKAAATRQRPPLAARHSPFKFAVTSTNEIVVADSKLNQIHVLDPNGELLRTFNVEISPRGHMATNDREIAIINSGSLSYGKLCVLNFHTGEDLWCIDDIPGVAGVCFDDASGSLLITRNTADDAGIIEQYCSSTGAFIGRLADEIERPDDLTIFCGDKIAISNKTYIQIFGIE